MQALKIPNFPVPFSIVVLIHFFFVSNALLTTEDWIPSYLFTNIVVILIGLWASRERQGFEPIIAYIVAVMISILNDMILLGLYFSDTQDRTEEEGYLKKNRDTWRYSAAMVIIHLILKPLCILFAVFAGFMRYRATRTSEYDRIDNQQQ